MAKVKILVDLDFENTQNINSDLIENINSAMIGLLSDYTESFGPSIQDDLPKPDINCTVFEEPELSYMGYMKYDIIHQINENHPDWIYTEEDIKNIGAILVDKGDCSQGVSWDDVDNFIEGYKNDKEN